MTLCCLFGAAVLFGAGYGIWDNIAADLHVVALVSSMLCYVVAFALIVIGFTGSRHATTAVVCGVALAFTVYASSYVLFKVPYYNSDALLFNSYSAQLLLKGIDPYTQSMQPGYRVFGVPEGETTPTLDGGEVYALSYPALSFLVYVPFLAIGVTNLLWVSVAAHLLIMLMLVRIAPARFKALAPFALFLDPTYFDYTVGGITDVIWLPAGILTAFYWRRNPVAAAAWLGVASAVKQTPWVIIPFAIVYWFRQALESRRASRLIIPTLTLAAAFVVPNLPFLFWHPQAWWSGMLTPLSARLIVLGTGVAQLATSGLLSISSATFAQMTLLSFCAVLALYVIFPKRLAFLPFFAPAFVFFFASRSLHNYFMYWPLVLLAYLFANGREYFAEARAEKLAPPKVKLTAALALCILIAFPVVAHSSPQPFSVSISGESRNAITGRIAKLRALVRNSSKVAEYLHFDVAQQGENLDVQAWEPRKLQRVAAGMTVQFVISAPSAQFELATDGSTSTQLFVVDSAGREYYSRPVVFGAPAPAIQNADLGYWSFGRHPFPVAWYFETAAWESGRIGKSAIAGRTAVLLRASESQQTGWHTTLLEQLTAARPATLQFTVYPNENYDDQKDPHRLFGIELRDVVGNSIYYTIDARRSSAATYTTAQGTITVLPGRLHAWNEIDVDLVKMHAETGFVLSPGATMVVGAVAAVSNSGRPLHGYFGGVKILAGDDRLDKILRSEGVAALPATNAESLKRTKTVALLLVARPQFIDDAALSPQRGFRYTGHWQQVRGLFDGRSAGTSARSSVAGSRAELRFDGSSLRLYGVRGPTGGRAVVTLDGKIRTVVDFYGKVKTTNALIYEARRLARAQHRFLIVVAKPSSLRLKRRYVNIDGADVAR